MATFTMPSLGADMEQGRLVEWLVAPGDHVSRGDIVAVVDTDKSQIEVETYDAGVVTDLLVEPGAVVEVGAPLAHIAEESETATPSADDGSGPTATEPSGPLAPQQPPDAATPDAAAPAAPDGAPTTPAGPPSPPAPPAPGTRGHDARLGRAPQRPAPTASPYARRLAREFGVDLDLLTPRADGVIHAEDVMAAARSMPQRALPPEPAPAPGPDAADRAAGSRRTIARLMARSAREIPHYYLTATVDLTAATGWLRERNRRLDVSHRIVPAALLLRAVAVAAAQHRRFNGFWVDDDFVPGTGVHLGVAVSLRGGGLVAPALHDADRLGVEELMAALKDVVGRARAGRLRRDEIADPTLTVTNLGEQGVESVLGVITPPQVALVGFGKVLERPFAHEGEVTVRPVTTMTLAADHRATDGFDGARFLTAIDRLLQAPEEL